MTTSANGGSARVYLDWNATTPPSDEVLAAMQSAAKDAWGNPASVHGDGRRARARIEAAREATAALVGADARDVVLTSGGTEANNLALRSAFPEGSKGRLLTSRLEHPSIVRLAEALAAEGRAEVVWLRVLASGHVDVDDVRAALAIGPTRLVAVQAVNHETGAVQPLEAIAALLPPETDLHVDAVQALGKVRFPAKVATTMSVAAHKMRGPKGIGALVTRPCAKLVPLLFGGAQERGLRPGTVDPVGAAGLEAAASSARASGPVRYAVVAALRDELEGALVREGGQVNGSGERAPHVLNVSFSRWRGPELVAALDLEGVSVSSGSACSAGTAEPSPVIEAMLGRERARAAIRLSLGDTTTAAEVARVIAIMRRVLARAA